MEVFDHAGIPVSESDSVAESTFSTGRSIGHNHFSGDTGATDYVPEQLSVGNGDTSDLPIALSCRQMFMALQRPRRRLREHPDYNVICQNILILSRPYLRDDDFSRVVLASNSVACMCFDREAFRGIVRYVVEYRNAIGRTDRMADTGGTGVAW